MAAQPTSPNHNIQSQSGTDAIGFRTLEQLHNSVTEDEGSATETYIEQEEVENQILEIYLKCIKNAEKYKGFEVPLQRERHVAFLRRGLKQLSDAYEALDASRPWLCYWILHSLNLLDVKLSKEESSNISKFLSKCQDILLKRIRLIDEDSLLRWLAHRQMTVEGGFQGRTNKLVDGCYSFLQGACFCLLGPLLAECEEFEQPTKWLLHCSALQEYVLVCCQHHLGGLIDKPGKQIDYYHTCYTLSGVSAVQHQPDGTKIVLGNPNNELKNVHPVFNLTEDVVETALQFYYDSTHSSAVTVAEEEEPASQSKTNS